MKNYIINNNTLIIMPNGKRKSVVYEGNERYELDVSANTIISRNCIYNGSTMEGRIKGTESLTGFSYKAPILVNDKDNIIMFPTSSPRFNKVCWVSLENIEKCYYNNPANKTIVKFNNGICVELDVSLNVMNNQILRASNLEHILNRKKA